MNSKFDALRVLVIDDEQSFRDGPERILTRINFEVQKASNGSDGLKILQDFSADIVLLDMKMPGMDGMEVLKQIMEMERRILVIVITGFATLETAIEAMKQGAYDFIPKPYEPDQLRIAVNRARETILLKQEAEKAENERRMTLSDLHTEKSRVHTIIEALPNGVLVTNTEGQVVLINPAFCKLIGIKSNIGPGKQIEEYIEDKDLCKLVTDISRGKFIDYDDIPAYELEVSGGKFLLAWARPVLGEKGECLGSTVNLMDISAMKVLDQLKSEFVAKVSHELRSPLSTIHEQIALVINDVEGDTPESDQYILTRAKEKTLGLISTIGDLLDLSRIEAGISAKVQKPIQVQELLKNIVEFLESRARVKGQSLILEFSEGTLPEIIADPMALESVFGNLITNAINYTQDGGEIVIKAGLTGKNIGVRIEDNGFGIEEKHLEKIFDKFYRVKDDKTRYITGTGLGLSIVKGIMDSLGGIIDVESEYGKGTVFNIILPVS